MAALGSSKKYGGWLDLLKTSISGTPSRWEGIGVGTLATIGSSGGPNTRMIVIRGFYKNDKMWFLSHGNSAKVKEIDSNPKVSFLWFSPNRAEQFRVNGIMHTNRGEDDCPDMKKLRQTAWKSAASSHMKKWTNTEDGSNFFAESVKSPKEPTANFVLLVLEPTKVEHLSLMGKQTTYTMVDGEWKVDNVFG